MGMFGLLNVFFRPLGGVVADIIYKYTGSVWGKKIWIVFCGVTMGCFELAIGILSGIIGATGNLGGIIFAIIFRYNGKDYAKVIWIIGAISIGVNVAVGWIRPVPKNRLVGSKLLTRIVFFLAVLFDERASVRVARGVRIEIGCIVF